MRAETDAAAAGNVLPATRPVSSAGTFSSRRSFGMLSLCSHLAMGAAMLVAMTAPGIGASFAAAAALLGGAGALAVLVRRRHPLLDHLLDFLLMAALVVLPLLGTQGVANGAHAGHGSVEHSTAVMAIAVVAAWLIARLTLLRRAEHRRSSIAGLLYCAAMVAAMSAMHAL